MGELIDFCSDDNVKQNRSMRPIWSLLEFDSGECSGLSCITKGALPCSYYTCTFFIASEQKESACIVVLLTMILLNLVYVLVPVDQVVSKPCSAVGLKIAKKLASRCWTVVLGGGSCRNWLVWFWVFFLPQWGICYVVLSGNLNNDLGSVVTAFISDILQDTQILLSAAVLAVLVFVAYLKREYITDLFGVKRHGIHLGNWNHDRLMTDEIRLCIWRVDAYTEPEVSAKQKKAPLTTMFSGIFTTAPATDVVEKESRVTDVEQKERRAMKMAAVGKSVQMFVRCCYGHNEDSATRVLNVPSLGYAPTFFGETFVVHLQEEDDWFGHPPSMHLQVLDQNAIGRWLHLGCLHDNAAIRPGCLCEGCRLVAVLAVTGCLTWSGLCNHHLASTAISGPNSQRAPSWVSRGGKKGLRCLAPRNEPFNMGFCGRLAETQDLEHALVTRQRDMVPRR